MGVTVHGATVHRGCKESDTNEPTCTHYFNKFQGGGVEWGEGLGVANLWAALLHQQSECSGKAGRRVQFGLMGRRKACFHPLGTELPIQSLSAGPPEEHQAPFPDKVTREWLAPVGSLFLLSG